MTDHLLTCFDQNPKRYVLYLVLAVWLSSLVAQEKKKKKKKKPNSTRNWQMVTVSWQIIYLNSQTLCSYLWLFHLSFKSPFINKNDHILTIPVLKSKRIHLFTIRKWVSDKRIDSDKGPKWRLQSNFWTITKTFSPFFPSFCIFLNFSCRPLPGIACESLTFSFQKTDFKNSLKI